MNLRTAITKKFFLSLIAGVLSISFILAPISDTLQIKKAEAQYAVFDALNIAQSTISAVANVASAGSNAVAAYAQSSLSMKELALDGIAWALINIVLKEMIRSTTQWVKSGFKGSPAFVTDLEGFLLDIADKVAGNFIYGSGLSGLCSPFKLNIQLALDIQYKATRGYKAQCRLSSVIRNVDNFLNGDFFSGGWDGWYNVAMVPSNNPYGAMLEAQSGLYVSIAGQQSMKIKMLDFGSGFFSMEHCFSEGDDQRCSVETPGVIIQDQLNRTLGFPGDRLAVADEINELLGALLSQVAKEALSGVGGLLGLNEKQPGYSGSYFDRISAENTPSTYGTTINRPFETEIAGETRYRALQTTVAGLISDASTYKARVYGDTTDSDNRFCSEGALTNSLANQLAGAERGVASSTALIARLNVFLTDYNLLTATGTPATTTRNLLTKYNASSVPEAQSVIMNQFLQYKTSGALHTEIQMATLEITTIPALRTEIQSFTASIDTACAQRNNGSDIFSGGGA